MKRISQVKIDIVTSVSLGIGRAIAERLLSEGYNMFGTFNASKEKTHESSLRYKPIRVVLYGPYDLTDFTKVASFVEELRKNRYYAIVTNSGIFF